MHRQRRAASRWINVALAAVAIAALAGHAPEEIPGYALHTDRWCRTDGGEGPDGLVSGVADCADACGAASGCAGFWLNGPRGRTDGLHFCRYYAGTWGGPVGDYPGNDCYLKTGLPGTGAARPKELIGGEPEEVDGYVLHVDSWCLAGGGREISRRETKDRLVSSVSECAERCNAVSDCAGFWFNGPRARTDDSKFCRFYLGVWGRVAGAHKGNSCYLKESLPDPPGWGHGQLTRGEALHRLGLNDRSPSIRDMKRAYRVAALRWHPDRWHNRGTASHRATVRFRKAREAYELLLEEATREQCAAGAKRCGAG